MRPLAIALVFLPSLVWALDSPLQGTLQPTLISYATSGYLHRDSTKSDYGFSADLVYPVSPAFRLKGIAILGLAADFMFAGIGFGYDFVSTNVVTTPDSESVDILRYRTWRPYVDVSFGRTTAQTEVSVGRLQDTVREEFFAGMVRAGAGYALDQNWEVNGNILYFTGSSSNLSASGYGLAVGVRLHLF